MWARQLLRRIEAPMLRFARNRALMAAKESKRTVRLYNRVAKVRSPGKVYPVSHHWQGVEGQTWRTV